MVKEKSSEKIVLYLLLGLAIIVLIWVVWSFYKATFFGENYQKALESENILDKCKTPPGYSIESWREHMSHHPDRYRECLT